MASRSGASTALLRADGRPPLQVVDELEQIVGSGVAASHLAAILASPDITRVVCDDVNAPLVTIAIDEAAFAPAVLLQHDMTRHDLMSQDMTGHGGDS